MSREGLTVDEILTNARGNLRTVKHGYEDLMQGDKARQATGVKNIATFGRALTRTLQRLKSKVSGFDEWYVPYRAEMKEDPLMSHFWQVRNQFLKQGENPTSNYMRLTDFRYPADLEGFEKPDNATSFIIGANGAGWIVELPDGSEEVYYIDLPDEIVTTGLEFTDAPDEHLGRDISNTTLGQKCEMYINYLEGMVEEAEQKWG